MALVEVEELTTGMVLKTDLFNSNGQLMLPAGRPISDRHIRIIIAQQITHVDIQTEDDPQTPEEFDPAEIERAREGLDTRFVNTDREDPLVAQLYEVCLQRLLFTAGAERD